MGYKTVVFIDTDAFVSNTTIDIPCMLRTYRPDLPTYDPDSQEPDAAMTEEQARKSIFFSADRPYSAGANTGFMIAHNTKGTMQFLRDWWTTEAKKWLDTSPFEQEVGR